MAIDQPELSRFKSKGGLRRIAMAFSYSLKGFAAALRHEAAFRQELALALVLIPLALWLPFSALERVMLIGSIVLSLIVELLNSAIEAIADRISVDHHPLAARAKDLGSAAVMLSLVLVAITWLAIAVPVMLGRF
jgi:diacylglycerol kinase (ATP)